MLSLNERCAPVSQVVLEGQCNAIIKVFEQSAEAITLLY